MTNKHVLDTFETNDRSGKACTMIEIYISNSHEG